MKKIYITLLLFVFGLTAVKAQNGWYVVSQLSGNYFNVTGIDFSKVSGTTSNGYLLANTPTSGFVYKTTDGGVTWSIDTLFVGVTLNAICFSPTSASVAWIAGSGGKIYKLSATGIWTLQTSGTTNELKDIQFVSNSTGYAVGVSGTLLKSTNGGSTWSNPVVSGGQPSYDNNSIYFTTASNGVMVGTYNFFQGFATKTVSGGQYWGTPVSFPSYINKVEFPTSTTGYAVGNGGVIYKTTNGGTSWSLKTSGVTVELKDLSFVSADTGYVVGANGTILKTTNGGSSWQLQSPPASFDLNGVYAYDADTVWAVGDSSLVLKTLNAGISLTISAADDSVLCQGYSIMNTTVSYNGTGTLQYSWAANPLLSNTNTANPIAGPMSQTTTFYVTVTDGSISASDSATVTVVAPPADSICLVSVMDSTNDNIIVFEKHVQAPIAYYKIYKETSVANVYDSIGFIPGDSAGIFIDTNVNPMVQAYRYKISSVDSCGNESVLSNAHKTIHLTINQGLPGQWNLIWNNYEGVFINTYRIWRSDSTNQNWTLIDSVAGNLTSYTDLNPPPGPIHYQIEIISSYMCQPYNYKAQTNYNTSRSNRANTGAPPTVSADFNAIPTNGTAPLLVQFNDASMGTITNWIWYFGDGDTAMTQNPSHLYTAPGTYDVTLFVQGGTLVDSITKSAFIDVVSSIDNVDFNRVLKVYPNPASAGKSLFVDAEGAKISQVEIFDIVGKRIFLKQGINSSKTEIKLSSENKGLFFMKIKSKGGQAVIRKLVIK